MLLLIFLFDGKITEEAFLSHLKESGLWGQGHACSPGSHSPSLTSGM